MKIKVLALILAAGLPLAGCGWKTSHYTAPDTGYNCTDHTPFVGVPGARSPVMVQQPVGALIFGTVFFCGYGLYAAGDLAAQAIEHPECAAHHEP